MAYTSIRALLILLVLKAIFHELSCDKSTKQIYKTDSNKSESLVVVIRLSSEFKANLLARRATKTMAKKNNSKDSRTLIIRGKQALRFIKYALAAIILQRSGDVAILLNPGPIDMNLPKNHLHFGQLNVNGLRNKTHEVQDMLLNSGMHFLGLTETKLDDLVLDGSLAVEGYQFLKKNRDARGGGIGLYYKDAFVCKAREDLASPDIEAIWVEIYRHRTPTMLLGIFYCPPNSNSAYMSKVFDSWEKATDENKATYILGDFNKNWFNEEESASMRYYANICCLTQTVEQSTRTVCTASYNASTCLDLVFTNRAEQDLFKCKVIQICFSDHDLTVLSNKTKIPKGPGRVVYKRSYKQFSKDDFINDLKLIPFWLVELSDDPNDALNTFIHLFTDIANIHAPLKKFTIKAKPVPWLTERIRDLMNLRDAAKLDARKSGFRSDWAVYRKLRNYVVKINRESKREFYLDAINKSEKNSKSMWNTINSLLGRANHVTPKSVECNGEVFTKSKDIANHFAKFFEEKVLKFRSEMTDAAIDRDYVFDSISKVMAGKNCHPAFEFTPLSLSVVKGHLSNLPNCKTSGVDNIDTYLLKIASEFITAPIRHIFNCSFATSTFPDQWKIAKLCPIPKDRKKNFR